MVVWWAVFHLGHCLAITQPASWRLQSGEPSEGAPATQIKPITNPIPIV